MAEVSVHMKFVPGEPTPPPFEDVYESFEQHRAHLLRVVEHYPTTVSVTVVGLTFTDVFEIMRDMGVTRPKARAREFLRRLGERE